LVVDGTGRDAAELGMLFRNIGTVHTTARKKHARG